MSRLKNRLERRGADRPEQPRKPEAAERSAIIDELRRRMERIAARGADRPSERAAAPETRSAQGLPGEAVQTEHGPVHVREVAYALEHRHGQAPIDAFLGAGPALAALSRIPELADAPSGGALFIDTETTGLSGGTGTLPFLVGVARFVDGRSLVVEQFLCRDPSEERAQLELVRARLAAATHLVSFNGRAFDAPLLNTRFVLQRLPNPGYARPHLDLLHVARRVFGRRLDDRSLGALEAAVLGFKRVGDIPGAEIPSAYAAFLRGGPIDQMIAILEHNALDLVALAALGGVLARMYADPESVEHAADHLGLARAAFSSGQSDTGWRHLDGADERASGADRVAALHMKAVEASRKRDFEKARDLLIEIAAAEADDGLAQLALAKLYEHRFHDLAAAGRHALRAAIVEGEEASARRIARLERKGWRRE